MHSSQWRYCRRYARSLPPQFYAAATIIAVAFLGGGLIWRSEAETRALSVASWIGAEGAVSESVHGIRDQSPMVIAFASTMGSPTGVLKRIGTSGETAWFTPAALVRAPFGTVLVSEGEVVAPRRESTGKLAITYLTGSGSDMRPRANFLPAIESGSLGRIDQWNVRGDLGPFPVIEVKGQADWDETSCSWVTLLELQPQRPVELGTIPISYDNRDAALRIDGRIVAGGASSSLAVSYSGSAAFTERYVRRGDRFELDGAAPSRMRTC